MASPLEQFQIEPIFPLKIAGQNLAFTNSALAMTISAGLAVALLIFASSRISLVPSRIQSVAEIFYETIANMVRDNVGTEGMRFFPFVFSLFVFLLFGNLIGLVPGAFAFTSHIAVTFALAATIFVTVTIIGFAVHGTHFFRTFLPEGVPMAVAPIIIPIEIISYLSRPISLSVRLFANMVAGHIILKVFAGFVIAAGTFYLLPGALPFSMLVGFVALEFLVALLQAYIFTILTCIYLNDAIHMH
ncbi:MAG: F0F1 ATP synthase subunit A [Proteobacteria bacterium]|nr:F0F1 ATP synthase subunit A [Pseudomonadota bacterium]